ncbi:hypothetical protein [Novosphingobium beihaiensis]|uniref:Uncharacterized protein n=1 Tax=Novosphingobium beihaiensis TaxID=2930389 RepID=A0ABT0BKW2_9SPHN|nr:hypothetical protein [Novosphingobium beihaiensis]MCJ2185690.1 hypothetical protein [Novosphingobium beihaiensis]
MPIRRPLVPARIATAAVAALVLLAACGGASGQNGTVAPQPDHSAATAAAMPLGTSPGAAPIPGADCDPQAPESPCSIAGHWRIAKVYNPAAADPLEDDREMIGATLTISANGDAPGVLRWDGPDTGQFDVSDICTGPYLSPRGQPAGDPQAHSALKAALTAWQEPGDAGAARSLGCGQGQWTVPSDASGQWYGLVLPLGRHLVLQWYEGRFLLLEAIR